MQQSIMNFLKKEVKPEFFKNKMFYTKNYQNLSENLYDDIVIITSCIPFDEYNEVYEYTKKYLLQYEVFPFLDTLDGQAICIGYGQNNEYLIYYFDAEFGVLSLNENYHDFCSKLETANFDWLS